MVKFLTSLCLVAFAATAINAQAVNSKSKNTGMNVMSSNSEVVQSNVQNVNDDHAYGGYYGAHPFFAGAAYPFAAAPFGFPGAGYDMMHGHHLGYGFDPYYGGHPGLYHHPGGYEHVHSASTNTGANIMSKNSGVYQNGVQNANDKRY